jgi:uncharacterized protein (TIGR03083 family)
VDRVALLAALRRDGEAFADAAGAVPPTAAVPACPGWDVAELVWHLGEVHRFWSEVVERRLTDPSGVRIARPADAQLLPWYRAGLDHLIDALRGTPDDTPVWTWSERTDTGFVVRRMAHETLVHRMDAEEAAGRDPVVDAWLASDGIDELLEHFTVWRAPDAEPLGGSVHLHCTDVTGEWFVREDGDGSIVTTREHARGDAAIRGRAQVLLRVMWRRTSLEAVEVLGDAEVAARFVARAALT